MFKRILVSIDGSEQSNKTIDHAVAIAEKFGSELIILTVVSNTVEPFLLNEGFGPIVYEEFNKYQDRMMKFNRNMLKDVEEINSSKHPNLNIRTILREGRPSATIVDVAEKEGCDLIVVGCRGIGGIKGWVLGSTSQSVAASCKKTVMIVK